MAASKRTASKNENARRTEKMADKSQSNDSTGSLLKHLEQQLLEHNEFFDMLVDMIPSKLYISGASGDDFNPKYFKGVAESSKEARKLTAKTAKRQKLNPQEAETTVQTKARLDNDEKDIDNNDQFENSNKTEKSHLQTAVAIEASSDDGPLLVVSEGQSRIEALRAKLQAKIAAHQQKGGTNNVNKSGSNNTAPDAEAVSKRAARRVEKNRRREEAKKRKSHSATTTPVTGTKSYQVTPSSDADTMLNDLQHLDFGRLTGLDQNKIGSTKKNYLESNKALQNLSKGKNLHKLLADAEAKRIRLEELQKSTQPEDKEKANLMEWTDTFKEADGVRVKADPAKLKKAIKRKDAVKRKSQKAWKTRMDQQKTTAQNRQEIRTHNIKARKQGGSLGANLSSKKIAKEPASTATDSGRRLSRAGFEGRKQDFLNGSKKEKPAAASSVRANKK